MYCFYLSYRLCHVINSIYTFRHMANLYELEARLMPLLLKNNQFRRKVKKNRQKGLIVRTIGKITLGNISI